MEGVMVIMVTSCIITYASTSVAPRTVVVGANDSTARHCLLTPLLETPVYSQASLAHSLVVSWLLSPGSWCTQGIFVPSMCLFPQFCGISVIKPRWPSKSIFLGFSVHLPDPSPG